MKDKHSMMFANRLKEEREGRKLTQTELAKLLGYKNYTTVSKWESGDSLPRGKELKILAEYFEVSADYLLGIDDSTSKSSIETIYNKLTPERQKIVYECAEEQLEEQKQIEKTKEKDKELNELADEVIAKYGLETFKNALKVIESQKIDDDSGNSVG